MGQTYNQLCCAEIGRRASDIQILGLPLVPESYCFVLIGLTRYGSASIFPLRRYHHLATSTSTIANYAITMYTWYCQKYVHGHHIHVTHQAII
jgi:hypothetical protein